MRRRAGRRFRLFDRDLEQRPTGANPRRLSTITGWLEEIADSRRIASSACHQHPQSLVSNVGNKLDINAAVLQPLDYS